MGIHGVSIGCSKCAFKASWMCLVGGGRYELWECLTNGLYTPERAFPASRGYPAWPASASGWRCFRTAARWRRGWMVRNLDRSLLIFQC